MKIRISDKRSELRRSEEIISGSCFFPLIGCKQAIVLYQTNFTFKNLQEDPVILAASRKKSFHISFEKERSKKLAANRHAVEFQDSFPSMLEGLGTQGFMLELCNGFRLLMDSDKGLITFESLKRNIVLLGLQEMRDDELVCMLMEGDLDGDGAINQMEFCILMFRLSPGFMDGSKQWMEELSANEM
ncbi:hypothetical protein POTOM_006670 [Populus tomentosa]|uniref:EF-hand domain-containing protein n=1 Tax=Populus tomentosa TaxID=118781 RepID=A0A8X8ALF2_POPTO|nr:hypothetical protein POTOM_006670 [Populus tomentosa]